ncbi:phenylacetate--CoA ligase family protein [Bacillus sp. 2205SS5-2]|uniref:phenylacetate--CoA ligase family protein n=1 Tax=Bacillus sp. 2205SS5-2 TaxID=3109031 RepID=UPI00300448D4
MSSFQEIILFAYDHSPKFREIMEEVDLTPKEINTPEDLTKIPVMKKDSLPDFQQARAPFGGIATEGPRQMTRIFMSPGPIYDPQSFGGDYWRFSEALSIAGFSVEDIVQNTFSYHLSPAGFMFDSALRDLGCTVIPAGPGNRELQIRMMKEIGVTGYVGTPSFLGLLLDAIEEKNWKIGCEIKLEKAFFTAEFLSMDMRKRCAGLGITVYEGYGTADCGCLAFEDKRGPGLRVTSSAYVQICDPRTGQEVKSGEGEVVVTLYDKSYPLIRFGTGDLSRWVEGYEGRRIVGVLGRVSDGVKVKGMFVREKQLSTILQDLGYSNFQAVVTRDQHIDQLEIRLETDADLPTDIATHLQNFIRVKPMVTKVGFGEINSEEKRLIDRRNYEKV